MAPALQRLALGAALLTALAASPGSAAARATTTAERITSLARAASDPGLADWQRAFYRERLDEALAVAKPARDEIAAPLAATDAQPVWSVIADTPRRQGHTLVLDDVTDRLWAFGGKNGTNVYNTVFVIDPDGAREWHSVVTQGPPPPARLAHAAVLDAANRRMIVYGGIDEDGSYLADAWALSLDGTPTWTELTPAGDPPAARANFVATVDVLNDRLLLFGGANGGFTPLADLWSLSLDDAPAWTALAPGGEWPAPQAPAALLVDEARHRLALVGLQTVNYSTNWAVWWLPLDAPSPNWTKWVTPYGNSPSMNSTAYQLFAVDQAGSRLVCATSDYYTGTASISLTGSPGQWTMTASAGAVPVARAGRAFAYDRARRRLLVSGGGGAGYSSTRTACDLSSLDLAGLAEWTAIAGEPGPRFGHALAFDPSRGFAHMFGGSVDSTGTGYSNALSNDLWTIAPGSPSPAWAPAGSTGGPIIPRSGASLAVDLARDRLLLFGGTNGSMMTNEVWQRPLSGSTAWTRIVIGGTLPRQRSDAACVYDPVGDRLLVFGGYDYNYSGGSSSAYLADLWELSLGGAPHWNRLSAAGGPPACRNAILSWDPVNACAYLVGGQESSYSYGTVGLRAGSVWRLSFVPALAWQSVSRGLPPVTSYPSDERTCAAYYDAAQGLLVRAAYTYNYSQQGQPPIVLTLAPSADTSWTAIATGGTPPAGNPDASGVFDSVARRLLWFGGTGTAYEGTWALSFGATPLAVPPPVADVATSARVAPNPARSTCAVLFALPRAGTVRLELLDLSGRRVRGPVSSDLPAGPGQLELGDLGSLSAGVYFARLSGAIERRTRVAIVH